MGLVEVDGDRAAELGIQEAYGVEVSSVQQDSPADQGGLEREDILLRYADEKVIGVEHFVRLVRETPVGREVKLAVLRAGSEIDVTVTIGTRKKASSRFFFCDGDDANCEVRLPYFDWKFPRLDIEIPRPRITMRSRYLGAELEPIDGQLADYFGVEEGVLVRGVEANTPGERAGLKAGDVIVAVDGKVVDSFGDVRGAIRSADARAEIPLEIMRRRSKQTLRMEARRPRSDGADETEARPVGSRRGRRF